MSPYVFNPNAPAFQPALSPTVTNLFSKGDHWAAPAPTREQWAFFDLHARSLGGTGWVPKTYSATSIRVGVQPEDVWSFHGQWRLFDLDFATKEDYRTLLANLAPPCAGHSSVGQIDAHSPALSTFTARFFTRIPANYDRLHALHEICDNKIGVSTRPTGLVPTDAAERRMELLLSQLNKNLGAFLTGEWDDLLERIGKVQVRLAAIGVVPDWDAGNKLLKLRSVRDGSPVGAGIQSKSRGWCPGCRPLTMCRPCVIPAAYEDTDASPMDPDAVSDILS